VVFIDLDEFKVVNDRFGHVDGDEILRASGALLEAVVGGGDTVARVGGDEYVVCCDDVGDVADLLGRAARFEASLRNPFRIRGQVHTLTASIGVALSSAGTPAEALLRNADAAMYAAKQAGGARLELFDDVLYTDVRRRQELAAEIAGALAGGQFQTYFQPEVAVRTGTLVGFEALARWQHPQRGIIAPAEFIEVAEASGHIGQLGRLVLGDGCRALASWLASSPERRLSVAINVSPVQLADPTFPDDVRAAIHAEGVPAGLLCLEVTESSLMDADAAAEALCNLKAIGVTIAIDDFGTGYSSLARLKRFPVDLLKIDRSFVAGLGTDPEDEVIVATVVNLAHSLGIDVIAEGVETQAQLDLLATYGCELGQGHLWSPAMPRAGASAFAARQKPLRHAVATQGGAASRVIA
jgi:diguanylate cyclase (GGDEF)-like protein